jgi:hypothetical protein
MWEGATGKNDFDRENDVKYWKTYVVISAWFAFSPQTVLASTIDEWVSQNIKRSEKVLCKREFLNEYFFLAAAGREVVKLGSRLDMTGYKETHTFLAAWIFQNEENQSLSTKVPPTLVTNKYVGSGTMTFAENIEYQTLRRSRSGKMHVTLKIKKCPTSECELYEKRSEGEQEYIIDLCEISIGEYGH